VDEVRADLAPTFHSSLSPALSFRSEPGPKRRAELAACHPTGSRSAERPQHSQHPCRTGTAPLHPSTRPDAARGRYGLAAAVGSLLGAGFDLSTGTSKLWDQQHSTEPLRKDVLITLVSKSAVLLSNAAGERQLLFQCVIADERN